MEVAAEEAAACLAANPERGGCDGAPVADAAKEGRVHVDEAAGHHGFVPRMGYDLHILVFVGIVVAGDDWSEGFLLCDALELAPWLPTPSSRVDSTRVRDQYDGPNPVRTS